MKRRSNNEGSIYQRKSDKRWVVQLPIPGRHKPIVRYCKTEKAAVNKLHDLVVEHKTGTYIEPDNIALGEWLKEWMPKYVQDTISDDFYLRKQDLIRLHIDPYIGAIKLQKLIEDDITVLYKKLLKTGKKVKVKDKDGNHKIILTGLAPQTVKHIHNILKPALSRAVKRGIIAKNPMDDVKAPAVKRNKPRTLTEEEISKYFETLCHRRLYAAFVLELCTGLRRGELLGIKRTDLNIESRELSIQRQVSRVRKVDRSGSSLEYKNVKSETSNRTIILPLCAVAELQAHLVRQDEEKKLAGPAYKDEGLVFCRALGQKLDTRRLYAIHCRALKAAKLEHTAFHNLRHTVATLLLEKGEDVKTIQELLGHADPATTLRIYAHVTDKRKADCTERLGGIIGAILPTHYPGPVNVSDNSI